MTGRERVDDFGYEVVHGNVRCAAGMAAAIASDLDALAAARDAAGPVRELLADVPEECDTMVIDVDALREFIRALDQQCQHGESLGCYCRRCDPDGGNE
jgi:hypothetical protein